MYIEIESTTVTEGTTAKGNPKREQRGLLWREHDKYPDKITMTLHDNAPAYPAGKYTIHDDSWNVNQWGSLELSYFGFRLSPMAEIGKK